MAETTPVSDAEIASSMEVCDIEVVAPNGEVVVIKQFLLSEPVSALKQTLQEFQETCYYTKFHLSLESEEGFLDVNEFSELANYFSDNKIVFHIVPDFYDVNAVHVHLKRVKDVIAVPPLVRGADEVVETPVETNNGDDELIQRAQTVYEELESIQTSEAADKKDKQEKLLLELAEIREKLTSNMKIDVDAAKSLLPKVDDISKNNHVNFGAFYDELLFRCGSVDPIYAGVKAPSACIKSILVSGWNPVPSHRRLQGDLLYIELVTADEGVFHITATAKGFFLNKSTRHNFDPTPASNPFFSHELFITMLHVSNSLLASWTHFTTTTRDSSKSGPLDSIATLFAQGKGDSISSTLNWNYPPRKVFSIDPTAAHKYMDYDVSRAQDLLSDGFGVEEKGASREWNDEIQAIRSLPERTLQEKVIKARFEYKVQMEFKESCKLMAMAVSDGLISPMNYSDDQSVHIYLYNGIFMSRAIDTDDRFKLFAGDLAHSKSASHDLRNQKIIMKLGVDGVSMVMCTLIDYMGQRFVGQTVIPGILSSGDNTARLMYGALESGKRFSIKETGLEMMRKIGSQLYVPERKIAAIPIVKSNAEEESPLDEQGDDTLGPVTGWNGVIEAMEAENNAPVKVDTEGEVSIDSPTLPHVGPLEAKVLQGTDGRNYLLEVLRLTPRDANYVAGSKGTGKISSEVLEKSETSLGPVYLLRHELIARFVQHTLGMQKRDILVEAAEAYRKAKEEKKAEKEEEKEDKEKTSEDKESEVNFLTPEITARCNALTVESLGLQLNPNCFFDNLQEQAQAAGVDQSDLEKDELKAREIAEFLYDLVLPNVTQQVRVGEVMAMDPASLSELLHGLGINMRYLGRLARLAMEQEQEDLMNVLQGKQRIQSMPYYWLEFLEMEITARACKHLIQQWMKSSPEVRRAPARTIASLLNHLLGSLEVSTKEGSSGKDHASTHAAKKDNQNQNQASKSKKKKGGKRSTGQNNNSGHMSQEPEDLLSQLWESVDMASDRQDTLNHLHQLIEARFCHELILRASSNKDFVEEEVEEEVMEGNEKKMKMVKRKRPVVENSTTDFLHPRINKVALLRRICQQAGLRVLTRDYDFTSATPFAVDDILGMMPRVKSGEASVLLPEIIALTQNARSQLEQRNFAASFALAQEASNWIHQITGPLHEEALKSTELIQEILLMGGDTASALSSTLRSLNLSVQLHGLDGVTTFQCHIQLAALYLDHRDIEKSLKHLWVSKYLLECMASSRHPEMAAILSQFSLVAREIQQWEIARQCLLEARNRLDDLSKLCLVTESIAEVLFLQGQLDEALKEQRVVFGMLGDMLGENSPKTAEAKSRVEKYLRAVTERNVSQAREKQASEALEREKEWTSRLKKSVGGTKNAGAFKPTSAPSTHRRAGRR